MFFQLGRTVATPAALAAIEKAGQSPDAFLDRHVSGDWGDLEDEDKALNDHAVKTTGRILSAYHTAKDVEIWIITEADRSSTTIMLSDEY